MGILNSLFGTNKNVGKAIDAVKSGVDMMVFTKEEKSLAGMEYLKLQIQMAKALGPSNIARRVIAITITGLWAFSVVLAIGLYLAGGTEQAKFIFGVLSEIINVPFVVVIGFYYAKRMIPGSNK